MQFGTEMHHWVLSCTVRSSIAIGGPKYNRGLKYVLGPEAPLLRTHLILEDPTAIRVLDFKMSPPICISALKCVLGSSDRHLGPRLPSKDPDTYEDPSAFEDSNLVVEGPCAVGGLNRNQVLDCNGVLK